MKNLWTIITALLLLVPVVTWADYHDTVVENAAHQLPLGRYFWQVSNGAGGYKPSAGYEDHYYLEDVANEDGTVPDNHKAGVNALTSWALDGSTPKSMEAFLHLPAGNNRLQLSMTVSGPVTFEFTVKAADDVTQIYTVTKTVEASAEAQLVEVMPTTNLPASAYYRVRINVTSGHGNITKITHWQLTKDSSELAYLPDYLSSPSVHTNQWLTTNPEAPSGNSYDWAYEEVMIPESSDLTGTYCMSLGVLHGYMGIQVNGNNRHDIIFSMWDNGNTDTDRNLPDYLRSGSLDSNGGVAISRFGGEGTGTKAYRAGQYWVPGKWVKFLTNMRPEVVTVQTADGPITYTNTICTAWYKTEGGADNETNAEPGENEYDGWHYIASHRLSGANTYFNGWYSFLENFDWHSGNLQRKAYYRNGSLHSLASGKWSHRNVVSCSHTDGGNAPGKRNDYGTGIEEIDGEPAFYMTTGGLADDAFAGNQTMTYKEDFVPITQEVMDKLLGRVEKAIQNDEARQAEARAEATREVLSNEGLTVTYCNNYSTQEGSKDYIVDGDEATYWHTNYGSGVGNSFPYIVDIHLSDAVKAADVEQIELYQSRNNNYRAKKVKVYYSDDNSSWTQLGGVYELPDANRPVIQLSSILTGHDYVRLEVTERYGGHFVLNEVYFKTARDIEQLKAQALDLINKKDCYMGYSSEETAALESTYANGTCTNFDALKQAIVDLAQTGHLLKFGKLTEANSISSLKAYTLHNVSTGAALVVKNEAPDTNTDEYLTVTEKANNWLLLRSEKWNANYLYNLQAQKYLAMDSEGRAVLTDKLTPVHVGTRSHTERVDNKNVTIFDGFTFKFDQGNDDSYLSVAQSASTRGAMRVAGTAALTFGAGTADAALWNVYDNYGITPELVEVNELLEDAAENGLQPWTRPQFGGPVWTWNTTSNQFVSADGQTTTAAPTRPNNADGPVYTFPAGVGNVTTAVNGNTDTSDKGGFRILGDGDNVTTSLGRWAGSIEVSTGAVATVEYSQQLKGTEPTSAATVWVDGTLNFKSSRTNFNMNDGQAQRWYIGENGKINTSFTQVTKSGDRTWNLQIIVADEPLQPGKVLVQQSVTRKVMTWGDDLYDQIASITVYYKDADGYFHEKEATITHDATGLSVTYTAMVNADPEPTGTRDLTYNFVHAGQTWASEQHAGANVGSAYPEISTTLPWGVVAAKPEGTVKADDDAININVVLNANYPVKKFVSTYDANGAFMKMGVNAKKQYCYADNTTFASSNNYDENNEAYRWQFVGNPFVGYTIYNKAGGKLYAPNNNTNPSISTTGETKWNFQTSDADSKGFFLNIHGDNSKWINRNGGNGTMAFTNSWRDAGSTFYTFAIEQGEFYMKNQNKGNNGYAYYAEAAVNTSGVHILSLNSEANKQAFTFVGSAAEGYKIYTMVGDTRNYVYAINKENQDSNVGFTTTAADATLWNVKYVTTANGVDYFNIIPNGGSLSMNARGRLGNVDNVGQWNAGNNSGSLWQLISTSEEDITIDYDVMYAGKSQNTYQTTVKKGSFYPSVSGLPYGLDYTVPTGITSGSEQVTINTTLASNYPVVPAATVDELTDANYFVIDANSDSHAYIHYVAAGNPNVQAHTATPSTTADVPQYKWAFVGNPFAGYTIYNKVGTTAVALDATAPYTLKATESKWNIVSGTASSFRVSPVGSNGTYISLSENSLQGSTTANAATNLRATQADQWLDNFTYEFRTSGVTARPASLFSDMTLWYTKPAHAAGVANPWMEYSLPIGNGMFGASLYGNVKTDMLTFVDKTLWRKDGSYGSYQYFGELYAESLEPESKMGYNDETSIRDYVRYLDLDAGKAGVSYTDKDGGKYTHEYIASNPDEAVIVRYTASNGGKINRRFTLVSGKPGGVVSPTTYASDGGHFSGYMNPLTFDARFKVVQTGGTVTTTDQGVEVRNADEVLLVLAGGTDFDNTSTTYTRNTEQLGSTIESRVNTAAGKTWTALYNAHKTDYDEYYTACRFDIGGENTMDTESLVNAYRGDREGGLLPSDLMLEQLYFAYGRYLSISSSRGGNIPNNLQGIWANKQDLPWHSDIHTNINVQMNYWPVETTNLSDMHVPFLKNMINETNTAIHDGWASMARKSNQNRGWTLFTESTIFGGSSSFQNNYVIANAWYATHLWQHYRYTLDENFLHEAFPAMLGCTQFWIDRLIHKDADDSYEAPNEWSPEHGPNQDAVAHAQQLVRELFDNTLAAYEVLKTQYPDIMTEQDLNDLKERRAKLDLGLAIENYTGAFGADRNGITNGTPILREWKYSNYNVSSDSGHRHHSHLMCLYPYSQFDTDVVNYKTGETLWTKEELYQAAVNSLKLRGDASTGWSMGWKMNLWARALDGDHTHVIIKNALRHSTSYGTDQGRGGIYYNLFDSHAPFQIDGNFGATAGMAECVLQSHTGVIQLLPALPSVWANGSMTGMKAVGNFTVSQEWADCKLTRATIVNNKGQVLKVKSTTLNLLTEADVTVGGVAVTPVLDEEGGYYTIACSEGQTVTIVAKSEEEPVKTYTYTIRNRAQNTKYAYYDAAAVNSERTIVALGTQQQASHFTFTPVAGKDGYYTIATEVEGTKHYVYAPNFNDADFNVCFTEDAATASAWRFAYTQTLNGIDYYNIIPEGGNRSWNARGTANSISTIGQYSAGNDNGSNWEICSTSEEEVHINLTFTNETIGNGVINITRHEGDFMPKTISMPYGVETTFNASSFDSVFLTEDITGSHTYTLVENYPFMFSQNYTNAKWYTTKMRGTYVVGYQETEPNFPMAVGREAAHFAFTGTPFGIKILCREAGETKALGADNVTDGAVIKVVDAAEAKVFELEYNSSKYVFHAQGVANAYLNNIGGKTKLGYWVHGSASTDDGSAFIFEPDFVIPADYVVLEQKLANAASNIFNGKIGYPTVEAAYEYYEALFGFGMGISHVTEENYEENLAMYNALLEMTNVNLPEDGKAYTIKAVHINADGSVKNAYTMFANADGQVTASADAAAVAAGQSRFIAKCVEGNKFILVNECGGYLNWFDTTNDTKSYNTKGLTEAYDETYNQIVLEHATNSKTGGSAPELTGLQRFGCLQMSAHPKNANTQYQYFCFDNGNSQRFVSGDPGHKYYNADGRHTFLFMMEEAEYAYNKPVLRQANGAYYSTIYLPFAMQLPEGIKAYAGIEEYESNGTTYFRLKKAGDDENGYTKLHSGAYVLFTDEHEESPQSFTSLIVPANANPEVTEGNVLIGSTDASADISQVTNPYVLGNRSGMGFYHYTGTEYPRGKAIYDAPTSSVAKFAFSFDEVGIVTAIQELEKTHEEERVFDLQGRLLAKPAKGLNIVKNKVVLGK